MSLALNLNQGKWRKIAKNISENELFPRAQNVDVHADFPLEQLKILHDAKLFSLPIPKIIGGEGADIPTIVHVIEQLAKGCTSTAMIYLMHVSAVFPLVNILNERQLQYFIEPMIRDPLLFSLAASEAGSGAHIWHVDSYSVKSDNGGYIIDAKKSWATSAGRCSFYVVPVRKNNSANPDELTLFIIDSKDENIHLNEKFDGMGLRGNSSAPVFFNKCVVPDFNRIGEEGAGFKILMAYNIPLYLLGLAALNLGIAEKAYEIGLGHVKMRIHSDTGKSLAAFETVRVTLAEIKIKLDTFRSHLYQVTSQIDRMTSIFQELTKADLLEDVLDKFNEKDLFLDLTETKIVATELAVETTKSIFQLFGGSGYKKGMVIERLFRDAQAGVFMAPDNSSLRGLIGKKILGELYPWQK